MIKGSVCCALLVSVFVGGCTHDIGDIVTDLGHGEVVPPSTLLRPGTIVAVEAASPFKAKVICNQSQLLGSDFDEISLDTSNTIARDWTSKSGSELQLKGGDVETINAMLGAKFVKGVSIKLANAKFAELNDTLLADRVKLGSMSDSCLDVVLLRLDENQPVTVLRSVLAADVEYTVNWDTSVSAELKAALLEDIAPELTTTFESNGIDKISGKGLFWGVKDDAFFLKVIAQYVDGFPQNAVADANLAVAPVRNVLVQKNRPIEIVPLD